MTHASKLAHNNLGDHTMAMPAQGVQMFRVTGSGLVSGVVKGESASATGARAITLENMEALCDNTINCV